MNGDAYHLIGAYALDALDEDERRQVEEYLAEHPEHLAEMRSLQDAAAALSVITPAEPPARLRKAVLDGIAQTRPLPPLVEDEDVDEAGETTSEATRPVTEQEPRSEAESTTGAPTPLESARRHRNRWRSALLAAAAAVVIGGTGVAVWSPWQDDTRVTVAQQITDAADAEQYALPLGDHRATITRSVGHSRAVLHSDDLAAAPAGKAYQMWLQLSDGRMVSAGLVPKPVDGKVTMVLTGDAARAVGAGMTLEPAGGSKQPTTEPMGLVEF